MSVIKDNLNYIKSTLPKHVTLVAVTKTHAPEKIMEVYEAGHKIMGENKVQELCEKYELLPKDIEWHLIGHLQTNKVKYIAPFVSLIHSVDSVKLLQEINKQAIKNNRTINCLLQIHIASEETKFGLSFNEITSLFDSPELKKLHNIKIIGFMGMATNTADNKLVKHEFQSIHNFFQKYVNHTTSNVEIKTLSIGMSSDYLTALENGSTMVRIGSSIFGDRIYP